MGPDSTEFLWPDLRGAVRHGYPIWASLPIHSVQDLAPGCTFPRSKTCYDLGQSPIPCWIGSYWANTEARQQNPPEGLDPCRTGSRVYRGLSPGGLKSTWQDGSGEKPEGKRLATDKRHRVDTDQEGRAFPRMSGGRSGWQDSVLLNREHQAMAG